MSETSESAELETEGLDAADVDAAGSERMRRLRGRAVGLAAAARRADGDPKLTRAVRRIRSALPGDAHFGDPLSLGGVRSTDLAGRAVVELTGNRPGVLREIGLGGLQLFQSALERVGVGSAPHETTLVFTDLVDFSRWALRAGDEEVLRVLREVAEAWEKPVADHRGTVVKRLGDGLMAAFADPDDALDAVLEAQTRLDAVAVDGWKPRMRAGLHVGRPRRLGGDYLGVAVNTAARLGDRAKADEILVSGELLARLDRRDVTAKRKRFLTSLKGAPDDLTIYSISADS
jgi:adenylate cyclase